jgi:hypothetical protein
MRAKFLFSFVAFSAFIAATLAQAGSTPSLSQSQLAVHVFPTVTRDDDISYLFDSGISPIQMTFFTRDAALDLKNAKLFLELPVGVEIHSVSVIEGWRETSKEYSLPYGDITRDGQKWRRWEVPNPNRTSAKLAPKQIGDYAFSGYFIVPFLQMSPSAPREFTARWQVVGGPSEVNGEFPAKLLPRPRNRANPKRFPIWISQKWTAYMDEAEFKDNLKLMRELGLTHADVQETPHVPNAAQLWKNAGIGFYGTFHSPLFLFDKPIADKFADPRNYFVGLDGRSVYKTKNYRNSSYCPSAMARPDSDIFKEVLARALDRIQKGATYIYSDHELDIYAYCFCPDCRAAFAKQPGVDAADAMNLEPVALIRKYPLAWYKFRAWQSSEMVRALKAAILPQHPNVKIGLNDGIIYWTQKIEGLGWGTSLFAEDVRLVDDAVDFHNVDALGGVIHDVALLEAQHPHELKKPIIVRAMGSLYVGWEQPQISARWELSKKLGRKMGYNARPQMQRLMMINQAATGARGEELFIGAHESDAAVANASDDALAVIAQMENVYLDGVRDESGVQLFDVTQGESPYLKDDGLISGDYWLKYYWRVYGGPVYRVHRYQNRTFISLFNWDLEQDKTWLLRLPQANANAQVVDVLGHRVLPAPGGNAWTSAALREGIAVRVPKLDCVILEITPNAPKNFALAPPDLALRQSAVERAKTMQPYDPLHYLEPDPKGLRTDLNWRIDNAIRAEVESGRVTGVELPPASK